MIAGNPWHSLACNCGTLFSTCHHIAFSSLSELKTSLQDFFFFFLVRIPVIGFRVTLIQYDFMLTWLHLQWPYFQISSHSQTTRGVSTWTFFFWGCNSNHTHHIYYCLLCQSIRFTLKMEWILILEDSGSEPIWFFYSATFFDSFLI